MVVVNSSRPFGEVIKERFLVIGKFSEWTEFYRATIFMQDDNCHVCNLFKKKIVYIKLSENVKIMPNRAENLNLTAGPFRCLTNNNTRLWKITINFALIFVYKISTFYQTAEVVKGLPEFAFVRCFKKL